MVLNKRGVFFSLAALFFVAILLFVFTSDYATSPVDTSTITIAATNSYRERLENSLMPMLLRERSFATLSALSTDAATRGIVLQLPADYSQAIMTKQYRGNPVPIMSLPEVVGNLSNLSADAGVNITIVINGISVRQIGAFQALYDVNYSYNLSSLDNTVRFNRTVSTYGSFFLYSIPDRYYNDENPWGETLTVQMYRPSLWNTSEFTNMSALRYYSTSNESPSLFGRLTGVLTPSPYGIEVTIPQAVTPPDNRTSLDWEYFEDVQYDCTYSHAAVYPSLRLSFEEIIHYNLSGSTLHFGDPSDCPPAP